MIELFSKKENCCGCSACKNICPVNAISMVPDREGFLYPLIDKDKCIECSLCTKVCAFKDGFKMKENFTQPLVYAAKHKSQKVRIASTSGGMFTAISDYILEKVGTVYGAAFDDDFDVCHQRADTRVDRDKFKGSKYVQSDLRDTYQEIKKDLLNGKYVLFTGTPCQTAGLYSFLNQIDITKLYLCDIVCHGTPSPLMWKEHVTLLEKKMKSKLSEYYFRPKFQGWHVHNEMCVFENGRIVHTNAISQNHKHLFYSHMIMRPSCHNCKFTNYNRMSDLTIADYRGIEKCLPDFDDFEGVSLVLINTPRGQKLFNDIKENIEYRQSNTKDCMQPQLQQPCVANFKRDEFWKDYNKDGYAHALKKYAGYGGIAYIKRILIRAVKYILIKTKLK